MGYSGLRNRVTIRNHIGLVQAALLLALLLPFVAMGQDYDAVVQDIWLSESGLSPGDTADVFARFENASSLSGPYEGDATFDVRVRIELPVGGVLNWCTGLSPASGDSQEWTPLGTKEFYVDNYTFAHAGTYTITAEIWQYDGYPDWDSEVSYMFDSRSESFVVEEVDDSYPSPPGKPAMHPDDDLGAHNDDDITSDWTPRFSWSAASDNVGIAGYYWLIFVGEAQPPKPPAGGWNWTDTTQVEASCPTDGQQYIWVHARDTSGNVGSPIRKRFTIDTSGPNAPSLVSPEDDQDLYDRTPDLSWGTVPDAYAYRLKVTSSTGEYGDRDEDDLTDNWYQYATDMDFATWTWKVMAQDVAGNWGSWSSSRDFTILAPASPIVVIQPNGGEEWTPGEAESILWSGGPVGDVQIKLLDSGSFLEDVRTSTANDGSYSWSIPSDLPASSDYSIKVTSTGNSSFTDTSDATFSLVAPAPQFELLGIEVTQCVQNWDNAVLLIEGKRTWVIAHIVSDTPDVSFIASVNLSSDGGGTWTTFHECVSTAKADSPGGRQSKIPLLLELQASWLMGGLDVEVVAPGMTLHPDFEGNVFDSPGRVHVEFTDGIDLVVQPVVFYVDHGTSCEYACGQEHLEKGRRELQALLPVRSVALAQTAFTCVDEVGLDAWPNESAFDIVAPDGYWETKKLRDYVEVARKQSNVPDAYWVGYYKKGTSNKINGMAYPPGDSGSSTSLVIAANASRAVTLTHEIGHCFGRRHVEFTDSDEDEKGAYGVGEFPYREEGGRLKGYISQPKDFLDTSTYWGYDAEKGTHSDFADPLVIYGPLFRVSPNEADVMSYSDQRWPSAYTYEEVWATLAVQTGQGELLRQLSASGERVLISGEIDLGAGAGTLTTVRVLGPGGYDSPGAGAYAVELREAGGGVLSTHGFSPVTSPELPGWGHFVMLVQRPAGLWEVALVDGATDLDSVNISSNVPTVVLTSPTAGETVGGDGTWVRWIGSDLDGDTLHFDVLFRADGGEWSKVGSRSATNACFIPASLLMQTSNACFRVQVSDGFHSTNDTMEGVVIVSNTAPFVTIDAPVDGAVVSGPMHLTFIANGRDRDDGVLSGDSITWASDLDGVLGTGGFLTTNAADLSEGVHTLSAAASDASGLIGQASVSVTIVYDADRDGMPNTWEGRHFTTDTSGSPWVDDDGDGVVNLLEWGADTDPTNALSYLGVTNLSLGTSGVNIAWQGGTSVWQFVESSTQLSPSDTVWTVIRTNAPPTPVSSNTVDTTATNGMRFYRIRAVRP